MAKFFGVIGDAVGKKVGGAALGRQNSQDASDLVLSKLRYRLTNEAGTCPSKWKKEEAQ